MKRTCHRCCALKLDIFYSCLLGHTVDGRNGVPLEDCPKPLTQSKYLELWESLVWGRSRNFTR